jgi:hypothetical protein
MDDASSQVLPQKNESLSEQGVDAKHASLSGQSLDVLDGQGVPHFVDASS